MRLFGMRITIYLAKPMSVKRTEHNRSSEAHAEAHALSKTEKQILEACQDSPLSSSQLLDVLGYKSRTGNFKKALSSLLHKKLLVRTIPNAPRSGKQKYKINT